MKKNLIIFKFFLLLITVTTLFYSIQAQVVNRFITAIQKGNQADFGENIANYINTADTNGTTPLMYAVNSANGGTWNNYKQSIVVSMVQMFFKPGLPTAVNLTAKNNNNKTILMYAAESLNDGIDPTTGQSVILEILQTLLTQPTSKDILNSTDSSGKTALEYAASSTNFQAPKIVMTLLLTPGITVPTSLTLTPAQTATRDFFTNYSLANLSTSSNWDQMGKDFISIDLNAQDFTGATALMYIAAFAQANPSVTGATNLVTQILESPNLDLNLKNLAGKTAAQLAPANTTIATQQAAQTKQISDLFTQLNSGNLDSITTVNVNKRDATNGATPLMLAAYSSNPGLNISTLANSNPDYNAQDYNGQTALMWAVLNKNSVAAIEALFNRKNQTGNLLVNVNLQDAGGMTALMNALNINNYDLTVPYNPSTGLLPSDQMLNTVNALLKAPNINFALTDYSGQKVSDYANQLATNGLDSKIATNVVQAINNAVNASYLYQVLAAIQNENGNLTNFNQTLNTIYNSTKTLDIPDPNNNNQTPLMYAIQLMDLGEAPHSLEIITALINHGAKVNAQDKNGLTPLMYAAKSNNTYLNPITSKPIVVDVINYLIKTKAADVTFQDNTGTTAYTYAQKSTNINQATIAQAVKNGASSQLILKLQSTTTTLVMVQAYIAAGADVNATDPYGNSVLYYAKRLGKQDIIQALEAAGAVDTPAS